MDMPGSSTRWPVWLVLMMFATCGWAEDAAPVQDEVMLKNGSRLVGKVISSRDGVVTIETDFAGTLEIGMDKVEGINVSEPVVVLMEDNTVHRDSSLSMIEGQLVLGVEAQTYPRDDLRILNPEPWEMGEGYRWTGKAGMAFQLQRGNTDTDELDVSIHAAWRSTRDRYRFMWMSELDKSNNEKTADNWQTSGRYDYFLTDPNYVGGILFVESDKFRDLDRRTMLGPYFGRQFFAEPRLTLSGDWGVSWVDEKYDTSEDQDYPATNWSIDASSNILGGKSSLYYRQLGIWNLDDTSDIMLNNTLGFSFPLLWQLEAAAEILLEYDSGSVEDVKDLDQTYNFRVDYSW